MVFRLSILALILGVAVRLQAAPNADFSMSVKQGCVPLTVNYRDLSSGTPVKYEWDFGNGNKSSLKNPSAIYYKSGNFTVTLTVWDAAGKSSVKTFNPIRVFRNPTARFFADTVACVGDGVNFTDQSVKADTAIVKWTWDYGDGVLTNSQNSVHAYSYATKFTVGLTVVDGFGCQSMETKVKYIRIKDKPKLDFSLNTNFSCAVPVNIVALNKSTGASSGYNWNSSSGATASTKDFYFTINNFGSYTVTLSASANGCNASISKPVNVQKLKAAFTMPFGKICQGSVLKFANTTTPDHTGNTYLWDWGDGTTDTAKNSAHTFSSGGTYNVTLTVTNGGCSDAITKQVVVSKKPTVNVTVDDTIICDAPGTVNLKINGSPLAQIIWDWGSKDPDQSHNPRDTFGGNITTFKHTYTKKWAYSVWYKATDATSGCVAQDSLPYRLHIGDQSVVIVPDTVHGCVPKTVQYDVDEKLLFNPVKSYEWIFSDDPSVKFNIRNPVKTFTKRGSYKVYLTVMTTYGCVLKDSSTVDVGTEHVPSFYIKKPKDICGSDTIHWVNTTSPDSIKKKYKVRLRILNPTDPFNTSDTVARVNKDSMFWSKRGGMYLIKAYINDNGCITYSKNTDTVWAHGPYPELITEKIDCKNRFSLISAYTSWSNRTRMTVNDTDYFYQGPFKYTYDRKKKNEIVFYAWNDTFKCAAYSKVKLNEGAPEPVVYSNLSSPCAPSKATFNHDGSVLTKFRWVLPNGDSSLKVSDKYNFTAPGKYTIKLIGIIDSFICPDTTVLKFDIQGAKVRGNVIPSGKCLPFTLDLQDSSAGSDGNIHTWQVGDDFIEASAFSTKYNINSVAEGDTSVVVKLLVSSGTGCKSDKTFDIPFSGPRIGYSVKRFTICDTPIFYFDAFVKDSLNTRFPVKYKWDYSNGSSKTGAKQSGKYGQIGMNFFTLTATDNFGCSMIIKDSFEVSPNMLQPLFKADPTGRFCPPLQCKFTDLSKTFSADIVKWEWDFGDGTTSQLRNPQKLYLLPGKYDLTLKVTSSNGCVAKLIKPGYVIVNGPRGSYDFDRGDACLPHKVQFRGVTLDSATMEWDLGDGVVQQGNYFTHIYNKRGRYIPAMILSDTLGCKYTLPPIDTIEIFDYPKATLNATGLCFHEPIHVSNKSISNHEIQMMKANWFLNSKSASPGKDSMFKPESRGFQEVRLIVENNGGCKDTAWVKIKVFAPTAMFVPSKPLVCLGEPLTFINNTISDTTLKSFEWDFADKNTSTAKSPTHTYSRPGEYDVQLIATDILDCVDTIKKPASAVVGDTIPPPVIPIRHASVVNNRVVELMYTKFPTFDFRKYIIYREDNGRYNRMAEVSNRNDTIFLDGQCNTLSSSYCYKIATQNLCLLYSPIAPSAEHCTIETKALGKLDANKVKWSPYIGFDSVEYYEIWRQDYQKPEAYTYISKVEGHVLNYTDTLITCNTRQNYRIIAKQFMGFKEASRSDTATAKPFSFNTTKPNLTWRATVEGDDYARVEWLNNAWSKHGMKAYLLSKYTPEGNVLFNNRYFNLTDTFFDDNQTNVHEKSYVYSVQGLDLCDDTTPVSNVSQTILLKCRFDEATQKPALQWNHYNHWNQEVSYYEIEQKMPDGSFLQIGRVTARDTQFIHMDAKQNCTPYFRYRVRAVSFKDTVLKRTAVSLSNEADAFPHSTLFIPDAFSPDKNNINELFGPQGQYISRYEFKVFNRWGEMIFSTTNCMEAWNGFYKDERCEQDVYLYTLDATGADKKSYQLKGTFHLFR